MQTRRLAVVALCFLLPSAGIGVAQKWPFDLLTLPELLLSPPVLGSVASGTGFVIHPDGYVLTNEHVVSGAAAITVLIGGTSYPATVVASDATRDVAVLKVSAQGLPTVTLGDSDSVTKGDTVYAIGCPRGICGTMTQGRVANVGVNVNGVGLIMMDLTITHGNSGGPLLDSSGRVVGITSAGLNAGVGEGTSGFSFAVPMEVALSVLASVPGLVMPVQQGTGSALAFGEIEAAVGPMTVYVEADCTKTLTLPESYGADEYTYANCDFGFLCHIARNFAGSVVGGAHGGRNWDWEGPEFQYKYSGLSFSGKATFTEEDHVHYDKSYDAAILQLASRADGPSVLNELLGSPWSLRGRFWGYSCESWSILHQSTEEVGGVSLTKTLYLCSSCRNEILGGTEGHICYEVVALADNLLICWSGLESMSAQGGRFEVDEGAVVLHITGRDSCNAGVFAQEPFSYVTSCVGISAFTAEAAREASSVFEYVLGQF